MDLKQIYNILQNVESNNIQNIDENKLTFLKEYALINVTTETDIRAAKKVFEKYKSLEDEASHYKSQIQLRTIMVNELENKLCSTWHKLFTRKSKLELERKNWSLLEAKLSDEKSQYKTIKSALEKIRPQYKSYVQMFPTSTIDQYSKVDDDKYAILTLKASNLLPLMDRVSTQIPNKSYEEFEKEIITSRAEAKLKYEKQSAKRSRKHPRPKHNNFEDDNFSDLNIMNNFILYNMLINNGIDSNQASDASGFQFGGGDFGGGGAGGSFDTNYHDSNSDSPTDHSSDYSSNSDYSSGDSFGGSDFSSSDSFGGGDF